MNKIFIAPAVMKELSRQSLAQSLLRIAFDWAVIISTIMLVQANFHWALYILAIMVIANRQHGLLIMMHDGAHFRFSRNKKLNDVICELFTAWPLFIRMKAYREKHLSHHQHTNTPQDPDFRPERYPNLRGTIIKMLVTDMFALNTIEQFKEISRLKVNTTPLYRALRISFYVGTISALIYSGLFTTYLMYWVVPAFTWLKVCLRIRSIADHTGVQGNEYPYDTRTVVPNYFDRIFLAPHSSSYHFGHHLFAAVPCYNLKKLHTEIMHADVEGKVHVTNGFYNLLLEFPWTEKETRKIEKAKKVSFTENMPKAN